MQKTGKHFIMQFTEANPDLLDPEAPEQVTMHSLDFIESYKTIFWVIPKTQKEKLIFEKLSIEFGENTVFFEPDKFKAFPLNDTKIKRKPLLKEDDKYYHFSLTLAFRNIFNITENLIKEADVVFYENSFKGNNNSQSRDNFIELKTKQLFEKLIPNASFYHSLEYSFEHEGELRETELDILGVSNETLYIIEVKAGQLNQKHRRGAIKGLKDRIEETINEGSYQCHRALEYINTERIPTFEYIDAGVRKKLTLEKSNVKNIFKISVTYEHFSAISANLKYLVKTGVLNADYKWTWIVSLFDLMIFADILQNENEFIEYLTNRISLYDREDVEFLDEIDILGFYLKNNFPLDVEKENTKLHIVNYKEDIDLYYTRLSLGLIDNAKPKKCQ